MGDIDNLRGKLWMATLLMKGEPKSTPSLEKLLVQAMGSLTEASVYLSRVLGDINA